MGQNEKDGVDRRGALECMLWAGTGVLWTMVGGVPRSSSLLGMSEAHAQAARGFTFLQISDSHIGFKAPANPNPTATLEEAIGKIGALPEKPAFMIHTGDITHLSKPEEFDGADQVISKSRLDTFYVPGEHDIPLWTVAANWGWGTEDGEKALALTKRFGSVTVLNGHIHQVMQKVEGGVTFHTARSTAFPQPAPGTAQSPGPMRVPEDKLRTVLGIATVAVKQGTQPLAITDSELLKA
jgi:hypothetical protein